MKLVCLFIAISLFACQSKKQSSDVATKDIVDTGWAKQFAREELDRIKIELADSNYTAISDAGLHIETLESALNKADSSKVSKRTSNQLIISHSDGQRLYELMLKNYKHALEITVNADDVIYFTTEIALSKKEWFEQKFANKKTYEALISLSILHRDIALIDAIKNKMDSEKMRQGLQKSYQQSIDNMRKIYE